jgi:hypothetical protein
MARTFQMQPDPLSGSGKRNAKKLGYQIANRPIARICLIFVPSRDSLLAKRENAW